MQCTVFALLEAQELRKGLLSLGFEYAPALGVYLRSIPGVDQCVHVSKLSVTFQQAISDLGRQTFAALPRVQKLAAQRAAQELMQAQIAWHRSLITPKPTNSPSEPKP